MAPKLLFRALLLALCLLLATASVKAFLAPGFRFKAPNRAVEQSQQGQDPQVFALPTAPSKKRSFWTRLMASNTYFDSGTKKVTVKERPRVTLDRETGKITEISPAPSQEKGSNMNPWNFVKETFYGTADAVKSVPQMFQKEEAPHRPVDGYSSTIEKTVLKSSSSLSSPAERLMKEYEERALDSTTTEESKDLFDSFKSSFYSTVDGISSIVNPKQETKPLKSPLQSFKPVVQPTLASSSQVKDALPDLKSPSPAKRVLAELKIRNWEEEQRKRKRDYQRQETAQAFKEAAYSIGDAIVYVVSSLGDLPAKLNEAAVATKQWLSSVPVVVENTVETVTSIPEKVDQNVKQVQTSVESSIETTKKAVGNVQALPTKIKKTVEDTRHNVDETFTNVKVLVGVEQKKPVPPEMPPPKPRTAEELAWDVAGGVATVTGKAAWFVTVGAAKLSFAGAKLAYNKLMEPMADQRTAEQMGMGKTVVASTTVVETPKVETVVKEEVTVMESPEQTRAEKEALDREVSDALKLAEKAMAMAEEGIDSKKKKKSELDVALQKAREAAVTATKQAVEIEQTNKS